MKRFQFHDAAFGDPAWVSEESDGEWVRYEDVRQHEQNQEQVIRGAREAHQMLLDQYMALKGEHEKLKEMLANFTQGECTCWTPAGNLPSTHSSRCPVFLRWCKSQGVQVKP